MRQGVGGARVWGRSLTDGKGRGPGGGAGRSSGCRAPPWGRGPGLLGAFRRGVPPFRPRVPSTASLFRPAPVVGATVAAISRRAALAAPEPTMSGPNGDLGMPVEAGAEGEDDGFLEAGDPGGLLKRLCFLWGALLGRGIGAGIGTGKEPQSPPIPSPQGGSGAASALRGFGTSTCERVPGNRSLRELWATGPVLQMGKLRPLQVTRPLGLGFAPDTSFSPCGDGDS